MAEEETDQGIEKATELLEEGVQFIGDRNAILFNAEAGEPLPPLELPDDFFEINKDDIRVMFRDLKENREALENTPFRTKAVREMEESMATLQRLNRYTKTVLRIQFPDRLVLQAVFNHSDSIQIVMDFLRQFLDPPDVQFQLYCAPPKHILKPEVMLVEAKLTPRALIYFGPDPLSDQTTFLKSSLLTRLTSPKLASEAALHYRGKEKNKACDNKSSKDATESSLLGKSTEMLLTSTQSRNVQERKIKCKKDEKKMNYGKTMPQVESHNDRSKELPIQNKNISQLSSEKTTSIKGSVIKAPKNIRCKTEIRKSPREKRVKCEEVNKTKQDMSTYSIKKSVKIRENSKEKTKATITGHLTVRIKPKTKLSNRQNSNTTKTQASKVGNNKGNAEVLRKYDLKTERKPSSAVRTSNRKSIRNTFEIADLAPPTKVKPKVCKVGRLHARQATAFKKEVPKEKGKDKKRKSDSSANPTPKRRRTSQTQKKSRQ